MLHQASAAGGMFVEGWSQSWLGEGGMRAAAWHNAAPVDAGCSYGR